VSTVNLSDGSPGSCCGDSDDGDLPIADGTYGGGGDFVESVTTSFGRITEITLSPAGGGGYDTIENNGSAVTQRSTINLSTEFTATDSASKTALALTTNGVAYSKLAQAAGLSLLGVSGNSTANLAAITAGSDNTVLRRSGSSIGFGTIPGSALSGFTDTRLPLANSSGALVDSSLALASNVLTHSASSNAGTVSAVIENSHNASTSSHATLHAKAGGTSGGNPSVLLEVPSGTSYRMLVDNADSDVWKLVDGTSHPAAGAAGIAYSASIGAMAVGGLPASIGLDVRYQAIGNANSDVGFWANNNHVNGRSFLYLTSNSGSSVELKSAAGGAGATFLRATAGAAILKSTSAGPMLIGNTSTHDVVIGTNATERFHVDSNGNVAVGTAALATNATNGFLYVPTCAGTPTGTPTSKTGLAPIIVNTTNNKLYFYSGGSWRDAGP
jgi:hypothetical protein